jgi:hypothetical protein
MKAPFSSIDIFRKAFNKGLHSINDEGGLGTFILACANATGDETLFDEMKPSLEKQYQEIYDTYKDAFVSGHDLPVVDEDLLVFLKLHAIGFDAIRPTEYRKEDIWKVQFNHLRSFRPRRITKFIHDKISVPYDDDRFNFNRSYLAKECFWQGELLGRRIDLFYNKYPFADLHGLLVVDREECQSQLLDIAAHQYVFGLTEALEQNLSGVGLGYNSYGAYASVNHLHFQMFIDEEGLPVTDPCWIHNGGERNYPAECHAFESAESGWVFINELHKMNQPYNLLYVPGKVYVYPRVPQGMVEVPKWSSGFTWYELSGAMIAFNHDAYEALTSQTIESELRKLVPVSN